MKNKLSSFLLILGTSIVLSSCASNKPTLPSADTPTSTAEVLETEAPTDAPTAPPVASTPDEEENADIGEAAFIEENLSDVDILVEYVKENYPDITISDDEIFTHTPITGTPYYIDNYMYYTPTEDWVLERYDPWGGYTEHTYKGELFHEKLVYLRSVSNYSAEPTTQEQLHDIVKDYIESSSNYNGGTVTDFHRINLNGNSGYSITSNKTESGVLDGTRLYFLVGDYLYAFDIEYNNEFIDSTIKEDGIASALNVISSFTVEPNYTNDHNDKYPCPANYDSQKYTWRETSLSRDLYGMYQGYANPGKLFIGQTFDEIWQMMDDPSCDFDYENFWTGQFFGNCSRDDIKYFADNGYDFLDLSIKIAEAGYEDAVLYFASIGQPLSGRTTVADNTNTDTELTEDDILIIYPDINGDSYITVGDADDFAPFYDLDYAKEAFAITNAHRVENGLSELTWDEALYEAAVIRAAELYEKFSHTRPDGTICFTVSNAINGENIAKGYPTAEEAMAAWMSSQGHKENILRSQFTRGAIAYYEFMGCGYWCQLFGY